MIKIIMFEDKWRITIGDMDKEVWEFDSLKEMQSVLDTMLKLKDKYGRLK